MCSLLGGGVASLIAPWSQWGVEKRKSDREHRRGLVRAWQAGIAKLESAFEAVGTEWYESLRPHLTGDEVETVEGTYSPRTIVVEVGPSQRGRQPALTRWPVQLRGFSEIGSSNKGRRETSATAGCGKPTVSGPRRSAVTPARRWAGAAAGWRRCPATGGRPASSPVGFGKVAFGETCCSPTRSAV